METYSKKWCWIKKLAAEREKLRVAKDFAKADSLRAQIELAGFVVKDTAEGPLVRKTK